MVGSGDHRPSLSQVESTICLLQVKLSVDPISTGSGGRPLMVTRSAGGGLEGQVTALEKHNIRCRLLIHRMHSCYWSLLLTNSRNHHHYSTAIASTVDSFDGHSVVSVVGDGYLCQGGLHGDW